MYKSDFEAIPRELKDALLGIGDFETLDDIILFEEKESSEEIIVQVEDALSNVELPDYWIVTFNTADPTYDLNYFVFERSLTESEEAAFFRALPTAFGNVSEESLHDEYGIY